MLGPAAGRKKDLIPILGDVRTGYDHETYQNIEMYLEVEEDITRHYPDAFALRVTGDSMEPEIREGDLPICTSQSDVDSGSLAIICCDGGYGTLKRVVYENNGLSSKSAEDTRTKRICQDL